MTPGACGAARNPRHERWEASVMSSSCVLTQDSCCFRCPSGEPLQSFRNRNSRVPAKVAQGFADVADVNSLISRPPTSELDGRHLVHSFRKIFAAFGPNGDGVRWTAANV